MEKDQVDMVLGKFRVIPFPQDCAEIADLLLFRLLGDVVQEFRPDVLSQNHPRRRNGLCKRDGEGARAGADVGHHVTRLQLQTGYDVVNAQARDPVGSLQPLDPGLAGGQGPGY